MFLPVDGANSPLADVASVDVPTLRAVAARPPYFHDGSAATPADVVSFYNHRFNIGFPP